MTASSVAVGLRVGIQELDELPPLPQNLQNLFEAATDEEVDIGPFAKLVEQDPAMTARIMGIANSAYFAQRVPVRSVADAAIRVLGLPLTKSLVVSIAVSGGFEPDRCPQFDAEKYWLKALLTAGLARTACPCAGDRRKTATRCRLSVRTAARDWVARADTHLPRRHE